MHAHASAAAVWHTLRRWERTAALVCVGALLAVVASCTGTLLRPQLPSLHLSLNCAAGAAAGDCSTAAAPVDWRLLFCPPVLTPWSFDYLELAWLRAASLVNASAAAAEGQPARAEPAARKLLQASRSRRRSAGVSPPPVINASAQLTPLQLAAVQQYARWSPGSMPWRDAGAIYVRLYKSGNDAFKANIMASNGDSTPYTVDAAEVVTRRSQNASLLTFTFVREPMARFISAYGEVSYRSVYFSNAAEHYSRPGVTHLRLPHGSDTRFRAFLRDLLSGAPIVEVEHVFTSVGALAMGVDFIGRLERFDADYARLLARLRILPAYLPFNRSAGAHASSADPTLDRAAAAAVLRDDTDAAAAVCLLLLPDFACLGYALPPACVPEVRRLAGELVAWRAATGQAERRR